jgi:hypothetical protein
MFAQAVETPQGFMPALRDGLEKRLGRRKQRAGGIIPAR